MSKPLMTRKDVACLLCWHPKTIVRNEVALGLVKCRVRLNSRVFYRSDEAVATLRKLGYLTRPTA